MIDLAVKLSLAVFVFFGVLNLAALHTWLERMAVKVVRRRELTLWEKLYIPQILGGLRVTSAHFFRNLFLHAAHRLGLLEYLRASVTFQYPEEARPLEARFRSRHRLRLRK